MNTKLALSIAALGFASLTPLAHAESSDFSLPTTPSTLTRAEVRADLVLWQRAGLDNETQTESYSPVSADIQQRMALYRQWRSGPEFLAEVSRQQGKSRTTAKAPSAQTLN